MLLNTIVPGEGAKHARRRVGRGGRRSLKKNEWYRARRGEARQP